MPHGATPEWRISLTHVLSDAEYRLVYFSPDPFLGSRVAVAALLRTAHGVQAVMPSKRLDPASFGGEDAECLVEAALRNLMAAASLDGLPSGLGPHFTLASELRTIPSEIEEPAAWLAAVLGEKAIQYVSERWLDAHCLDDTDFNDPPPGR